MSDMYEVRVRVATRSYKYTHLWVVCTRLEGSHVLMLLCTGAWWRGGGICRQDVAITYLRDRSQEIRARQV